MGKLFKKSLLLSGILFALILSMLLLSAKSPYREKMAYWTMSEDYPAGEGEVEAYIQSVRTEKDYTKLILGDSVCNQLFNNLQEYNGEYCIVGNNRGLTMAGQYLLMNEFLNTHENVTDVYLIVGLDALESEIDITYGYQYVVVPFSRIGVLDELEDETLDEMADTYGTLFLNPTVAVTIGDSSVARKLYLNYLKQKYATENPTAVTYGNLSDTTVLYLNKMYEMCDSKGIALHLLPDPLADTEYRREQADLLLTQFEETGLKERFPEYFSMIQYYPLKQFVDGVHFGEGYNNQTVYNEKIQELYLSEGYIDGLCLDETYD